MVDKMLNPRIIGIGFWRFSELPPRIINEFGVPPIFFILIKRRVGKYKIRFKVGQFIAQKGPLSIPTYMRAIETPQRQIHPTQPPRRLIRFLPINTQITPFPLMCLNKFIRHHKHTTRTTTRVINTPFVRL